MKRRTHFFLAMVIVVSLFSILLSFSGITVRATGDSSITDNQRIVQETAEAYFRKRSFIQYDDYRLNNYLSPEEITSQDGNNLVCASYIFAVYYNAFSMYLPQPSAGINSYAKENTSSQDIVYYNDDRTELESSLSSQENRNAFKNELLSNMEVGDVISYLFDGNTGHTVLVYDFTYNNDKKTDAKILQVASDYPQAATNGTKRSIGKKYSLATDSYIGRGLSWNQTGAVKETTLSQVLNYESTKRSHSFVIYRPLASDDGTYNKVVCSNDNAGNYGQKCTSSRESFLPSQAAVSRLAYPGIDVSKTVDVFNNSTVGLGEELTYTITIKNNSDTNYENIVINETVPEDLVYTSDGKSSYTWTIPLIEAGKSFTKTYSVTVRDDESLLGKDIVSTGSVNGLKTATVVNHIGRNLTEHEKELVVESYKSLRSTYSGAELIDQIYKDALDKDLGFSDLLLGALYKGTNSDIAKCNPYYKETDSNSLIYNYYNNAVGNLVLNQNNEFSKLVLGSYYSALSHGYNNANDCNVSYIGQYWFTAYNSGSIETAQTTDRRKVVYPETLETGDVLVYMNKGENDDADKASGENGTYAFIWIEDENGEGNFYGVNRLENGERNVILGRNNINDNGEDEFDLWSLYGRDYYAIFRPSLGFELPADSPSAPETGLFVGTNDGLNISYMLFAFAGMIGVSIMIIKLNSRRLNRSRVEQFINQD